MFDPIYTTYQTPQTSRGSERMEIASLVLGILAVSSCLCLYLSIPCGALAVILASLSRGGQMQYGSKAQVGMILGIIGLAFTILIYGASFAFALHEYGSIEGILKAYSEMNGMDYEDLMQQLYPQGY